ncbi:MAG: ribonuclease HI family protein [Nanoarchaeota archaeon]|nr:ribonuclease HI family protein [Nanoarchaeota archaeon]
MVLKIYTDGGSRGNPGKAACSFIVVENNEIIKKYSEFLGIKTNNEAEYNAIIKALEYIKDNEVEVFSDSELVVKQLNGEYKITKEHLRELNEKINILTNNRKVKFANVKRENKFIEQADLLVNKELDKH